MSLWPQSHILNPNEHNTILILQILVPISVQKNNKVEYALGWAYFVTEKQLPYKHVVSLSFTAVLVMSGFKKLMTVITPNSKFWEQDFTN